MKAPLLLGNPIGEWEEANEACMQADALWRVVRRSQNADGDDDVDNALDELRKGIDELKEILKAERLEHDTEDEVEDMIAEYDGSVEDSKALQEAEWPQMRRKK